MKKKVLGLVGPTASGKTALSLMAAQALHGEIVGMDSMQIYQLMDIGTAKPTREERALAQHHLVDFVPPCDTYSVSQYAAAAREKLDVLECPLLVGGTGLYLQAVSQEMDCGGVPGSEALRAKYHAMAETEGNESVHRVLEACDPDTARRLHPNDLRRVIRAIEVYELTGVPASRRLRETNGDTPYRFILFAIDWPREQLYARVERRVDDMMRQGLMDEVRTLVRLGVPAEAQSMQGLGYKELYPLAQGSVRYSREALDEAVSLIKLRTRHYAKRQLTWFRHDERVQWLPCTDTPETMLQKVLTAYEQDDYEQEINY